MLKLEGKVAIVTGASSGIGRSIALHAAREGAKVVCSDVRLNPLEGGFDADKEVDTAQAIRNAGGEAIYIDCDVSKVEQVESLVKAAVDRYGHLDIIFNNAGIFTGFGRIVEKTAAELDRTLSVNVKGVWNGCQQAIKQFLAQGSGGKIINTSSVGGFRALQKEPDYCTSKGAVIALTKQLAADYGPKNIYVNAICPGMIMTSIVKDVPDAIFDYIRNKTPLRRTGTPEDVAKVAIFLASGDSDYITGQYICIDGGDSA